MSPLGGGGSVTLEPVAAVPSSHGPSRRLVYTCVASGLVTFSDRPCGPLLQVRELVVHGPTAPSGLGATTGPSIADSKATRPASRRHPDSPDAADEADHDDDVGTDPRARQAETCARLEQAVRQLDDRMRAGYSAREAGRLWARWREAKERVREAGC